MRIQKVAMDWHASKPDIAPEFLVYVDDFPSEEGLKYAHLQENSIYYAKTWQGMLKFFYYPGPGKGNNEQHFPITLTDGTDIVLEGPWSCRTGVINTLGIGQYVDVTLIRKADYKRKTITLSYRAVSQAVKKGVGKGKIQIATILIDKKTKELVYVPYAENMAPKHMEIKPI